MARRTQRERHSLALLADFECAQLHRKLPLCAGVGKRRRWSVDSTRRDGRWFVFMGDPTLKGLTDRSIDKASFLTPGGSTTEDVAKLLQRKEQIEVQLANLEKYE